MNIHVSAPIIIHSIYLSNMKNSCRISILISKGTPFKNAIECIGSARSRPGSLFNLLRVSRAQFRDKRGVSPPTRTNRFGPLSAINYACDSIIMLLHACLVERRYCASATVRRCNKCKKGRSEDCLRIVLIFSIFFFVTSPVPCAFVL